MQIMWWVKLKVHSPCYLEEQGAINFPKTDRTWYDYTAEQLHMPQLSGKFKIWLTEFHPRWHKSSNSKDCQLEGCTEKASRLTRLANHEDIEKLLKLSLKVVSGPSDNTVTHLCDSHYRALHKELNPQSYQNKCVTCGLAIRGTTHIRHCPNPDLVQKHLQVHTDFVDKALTPYINMQHIHVCV